MKLTAVEYENMAREYLNPKPEATESVDTRLKEAQIYATLAVAEALEKIWDQLSYINRKIASRN